MVWITALALAALNSQVSPLYEVSCDLAPYVGGGSSSDGRLDSLSGVGLGCGIVLWNSGAFTVGPRLAFTEQRWTVFRKLDELTFYNSYQARSLGLGLDLGYRLSENWQLGYSVSYARGTGDQDQNVSSTNSAQNLHYIDVQQASLNHALTVTRRYNERLSFFAGVLFDNAQQTWDAKSGKFDLQKVAPNTALTLSSGTAAELNESLNQSANYKATSLTLGVRMRFH